VNRPIVLNLTAVILAVTADQPRVLTVRLPPASKGRAADPADLTGPPVSLPSGPLDPAADRTLELALRGWISAQTGIEVGYVEQLYTFGDRGRHPHERSGGSRLVSVAYLALVQETAADRTEAGWQNCYDFLPWEDRRSRQPALGQPLQAALAKWARSAPNPTARRLREERIAISFGLAQAGWDGYRVLERYELLYEAGQVPEAWSDTGANPSAPVSRNGGLPMALDHRRMLATALSRVRGKLKYRPVVFELLPATFTLLQLQRVVEALAGIALHKQNFRRLVEEGRLVEGTGVLQSGTPGRPAELFRFRREVLRERQGPGMRLPGIRSPRTA
jgi:hypothetical protein